MVKITGLADEISAEPGEQIAVLRSEGLRFLEFRGVWNENVLALATGKLTEFRRRLDDAGIGVSAIASPVGKVKIDTPFGPELDRFKRSLDVAERMGAAYVRVFSYYPPEGGRIEEHRAEVLERMRQKVEAAQGRPVTIFCENESDLYGMSPEHCREIIDYCGGRERLVQCFDPGNFVHRHFDPWQAWQVLGDVTGYFHIKDGSHRPQWHCTPAGEGEGRLREILADAIQNRKYDGFLSLEPHLSFAGKNQGFSGPELFRQASRALKKILEEIGAGWE